MSFPFIIVDAHQDIAFNFTEFRRDFRESALKKRSQEDNSPAAMRLRGVASVGLPEMLLGRVAVAFNTLFVTPRWAPWPTKYNYDTPEEAFDHAMRQLDYYKSLVDTDSRLVPVYNQTDLQVVLDSWADGTEVGDHRLGMVLLMEGADPILEPAQLEEWYYEHGLRILGPAWSETRYTGGTWRPGPLTRLGVELLDMMAELGMILDLSHMAEESFFQAIDLYEGPVIASHSNPRRFVNSDRMLTDEMILHLAERDGVIGVVPFNRFMTSRWYQGMPKQEITVEHYIDIIDYVCQITGSVAHVGIGSDWDGGFGSESIPHPFDTIGDLWMLKDAMQKRGFHLDHIKAVLGGNFLRVLFDGLPEA